MEVTKTASCEYWFELNGDVLGVKIRRDHFEVNGHYHHASKCEWVTMVVETGRDILSALLLSSALESYSMVASWMKL